MKPGEMIEWIYVHNGEPVLPGEIMWSPTENRYVQVGREMFHVVVSYDLVTRTLTWMNQKGIFHSLVDNIGTEASKVRFPFPARIVPRIMKK